MRGSTPELDTLKTAHYSRFCCCGTYDRMAEQALEYEAALQQLEKPSKPDKE
jgi:hypothetical protein